MFKVPTLVSLFLLVAPKAASSSPCLAFDADFNLLAFGLDGKDWSAGQQDSWTSGKSTAIQGGCPQQNRTHHPSIQALPPTSPRPDGRK